MAGSGLVFCFVERMIENITLMHSTREREEEFSSLS
jgi:hypothetical protein